MPEQVLVSLREALTGFAESQRHQDQAHIRPLHWHLACRLVVEGGFHPDTIVPRPPFDVETVSAGRTRRHRLLYSPSAAHFGEQTVLGGLKTKSVDVLVSTRDVGPCLAVSVKGSLNAFRNLTNRMEEAVGDCTNLHIAYPTLVYGFLHIIKANHEHNVSSRNDIAILDGGNVAHGIQRYHDVLRRLTGRSDVRNESSRYEAIALGLVETEGDRTGVLLEHYPPTGSELSLGSFFERLYSVYDLRFVYSAPALRDKTARFEWAADSPALEQCEHAGFKVRVGDITN